MAEDMRKAAQQHLDTSSFAAATFDTDSSLCKGHQINLVHAVHRLQNLVADVKTDIDALP